MDASLKTKQGFESLGKLSARLFLTLFIASFQKFVNFMFQVPDEKCVLYLILK